MISLYLTYIDDAKDKKFFEELYYSYRKQMIKAALSVVKNDYDAEDAVHTVFLKIATKHLKLVEKIDNKNDLRNYLLKAAKNTAINILNKANKKDLQFIETKEESTDRNKISDMDFLDKICNKEDYNTVLNAINALDEKYSLALYYHFVMGFTAKEIADLFNLPSSTVKKHLVRGKSKLLAILEEKEVCYDE